MKTITKTIKVNAQYAAYLKHLLTKEPSCEEECFGESRTTWVVVPFPDGIEIDIKCCGVRYEEGNSNLPWTEAVMYQNHGECCFTEPGDAEDFFGRWELDYNDIRYVVFVEENDDPTVERDVIEGEDRYTYDVVLCERPIDVGLTLDDIKGMYPLLSSWDAFPVEFEAKKQECYAIGFITPDAAEELDYVYDELGDFVAKILDDMNNEKGSHEYFFNDEICVYLSRNF